MQNKIYKTPTSAFENLFHYILGKGEDFAGTKAIFNSVFTIQDPTQKVIETPKRKFNQEYADYEIVTARVMARNGGQRDLPINSQGTRLRLLSDVNVPDTNFGT